MCQKLNWKKAGNLPQKRSKINLVIGFETGVLCLWDLPSKRGEQWYSHQHRVTSVAWHFEVRQFVCSCSDGSLVTWNVRPTSGKPVSTVWPHKTKEVAVMWWDSPGGVGCVSWWWPVPHLQWWFTPGHNWHHSQYDDHAGQEYHCTLGTIDKASVSHCA